MSRSRLMLPVVVALGAISLALMAVLVFMGVQRPQNATKSEAVGTTTDPSKCQGNPSPSAKCFKCEEDKTVNGQTYSKKNPIGVLDFGCFNRYYGKSVGKP